MAWVLGASAESVLHCTGGRTRGRTAQEGAERHNRGQNCTTGGRTRGRTAQRGRTTEHGAELHSREQNRGQNCIAVAEPQNRGQNCTTGDNCRTGSRTAQHGAKLKNRGKNCRTCYGTVCGPVSHGTVDCVTEQGDTKNNTHL